MRIECFYYQGCGSRDVLPARVGEALALAGVDADVSHRTLAPEEALARGIPGSPTVLINGEDILAVTGQGGT